MGKFLRPKVFLLWLLLVSPAFAQHVHVQVSYASQQWHLFIYDFEGGSYEAGDAPFVVGSAAFGYVPNASVFTNFLGPVGSPVWTLPETENPNVLYLGVGTGGIAPGTFANHQVRLELRSLSGPGSFALYNIDPFGTPIVRMNSRDGLNPAVDFITLASVGGHVHLNWAFSAPGTYHVGLGASGVLAGNGQTNASPTVDYTFIVQDIPWRPRLAPPRPGPNDSILLTVQGGAGHLCQVWATTNFQSWAAVTNFTMTSATQTVSVPAPPGGTRRFFKASLE